jgi:hypothetical protein
MLSRMRAARSSWLTRRPEDAGGGGGACTICATCSRRSWKALKTQDSTCRRFFSRLQKAHSVALCERAWFDGSVQEGPAKTMLDELARLDAGARAAPEVS